MPVMQDNHFPQRWLRLAALMLMIYAAISLYAGQLFSAAGALLLAGLLPCLSQQHRAQQVAAYALSLGLLLFLLFGMMQNAADLHLWLFLFPLIAFLVWPTRWAILWVGLYLIAMVLVGLNPDYGILRVQLFPALLLGTGLSLIFVFLREYKARQMAPLRRTDTLTLASTREHLTTDLRKEIQRSEREGTDLTIMLLVVRGHDQATISESDHATMLVRVGHLLHQQLRDFDSYYRVAESSFLIILPGNNTATAVHLGERLRRDIKLTMQQQGFEVSVSAGIAGLNVGDDADSLQNNATLALKRAQQQGGNRIQSYSSHQAVWSDDADGAPHAAEEGKPHE